MQSGEQALRRLVEGGKNGGDATREEIKEGMGKPPFTPAGERDFEKCVSALTILEEMYRKIAERFITFLTVSFT